MLRLSLLLIAMLALVARTVEAGAWAQFCNTDDCNDCGTSVSLTNPGCLNENGRKTVKFHGYSVTSGASVVNMVVSPSPNCPCEASCTNVKTGAAGVGWTGIFGVIGGGGCMAIPPGQSFRFQSQTCKQYSNCPSSKRTLPAAEGFKNLDHVAERDLESRGLANTTLEERAICGTYAQFCDDQYCTKNCGIAVCTTNPGCLNENGRKTIRAVYGNVNNAAKLVVSPTPDCPCQKDCVAQSLSCQAIPEGQSYRFVTGESETEHVRTMLREPLQTRDGEHYTLSKCLIIDDRSTNVNSMDMEAYMISRKERMKKITRTRSKINPPPSPWPPH
ncbi:unnamed protein product [Sympodiomycopsis kandeliae]